MNTKLNAKLATGYKSVSQQIRIMTEAWVHKHAFCPSCGYNIDSYEDNRPVADFHCLRCVEDYELKSKKNSIGKKVVDGAYESMIRRLLDDKSPSFFLLTYEPRSLEVTNLVVIPSHFFVPEVIERRKALSPNARRAGWVGCNISLRHIPNSGKIFYIRDKTIEPKQHVLSEWQRTLFLRESEPKQSRGWIVDVMRCAENFGKNEFTLQEMYGFEGYLADRYPQNKHVKDKIRQQLQLLRDRNYLEFLGRGKYRLMNTK